MTNQVLRNISWLAVGNVVVKPIWFVFITYVCIRYMGLEQYGSMTATLGLMAILDGTMRLGTSDYSIREIARDQSRSSRFFSNFLPFRALAALVAIGVGIGIELVIGNQNLIRTATFAGTYVLARNLTEYCRTLFRAHEVFKYEAISTIWEKIFVVGMGTLFLARVPTASSVLLGMTIGMLLTLGLNFRWVVPRFASIRWTLVQRAFFREHMPKALPLGLASIFVLLYFRTDSVMIQAFKGDLVTGQYGLAFRVVEALLMLPAMVTAVMLPRLSDLYGTASRPYRVLGLQSVFGLFGMSTAIAVVISLSAAFIVTTLDTSPNAVPAIALMRVLIWVFPLAAANSALSTMMVAADRQKRIAYVLGIAATLNIALNLILIPRHAAMGAAIATIATQLVVAAAFLGSLPPRDVPPTQ